MVSEGENGAKKLSFLFPEGPVLPRPEPDIVEASKKRVRAEPEVRRAARDSARKPKVKPEPMQG